MSNSFKETLIYISEKLNTLPPDKDIELGEVELVIDKQHVILKKNALDGGCQMMVVLGLLLQPISESRLKELATSNFLGINTRGCKLALDEAGVALTLHSYSSSDVYPEENWGLLHRIVTEAREWNKRLALWDEFVSIE